MITEQDIIAILEFNGNVIETDNYTYEAVERTEYAKVAQEIVKKLNYDPVKIERCKIKLENLQVKSLKKAKKLAKALEVIEEECGIHEVEISIEGFFVCPWIELHKLDGSGMEKLLAELFVKANAV